MPWATFDTVRIILQSGYASHQEIMSVAEWSKGIKTRVGRNIELDISRCLPFFQEIGLLEKTGQKSYYRLTDRCQQLGKAIQSKEVPEEIRLWKSIVEGHLFFKEIIDGAELSQSVNGSIKKRELKEEIIRRAGKEKEALTNNRFFDVYAKTIISLLIKAKFLEEISWTKLRVIYKSPTRDSAFISLDNIDKLRAITNKDFDLSRLIRYCDQINENYSAGNFETVAFLSRAIIHHIPPIFGKQNFESVGSQTANGRDSSFKKSCVNLQNSLKHIVDDLIHAAITKRENPISVQEINFSADLNRVIREIIDQF